MKDYLGFENARNKRNAALYTAFMQRAVGSKDVQVQILIGHHLTFELNGDLETENEVPSADCLMFDHYLMGKVFGDRAVPVMQHLASVPCEQRDALLGEYMESLG